MEARTKSKAAAGKVAAGRNASERAMHASLARLADGIRELAQLAREAERYLPAEHPARDVGQIRQDVQGLLWALNVAETTLFSNTPVRGRAG